MTRSNASESEWSVRDFGAKGDGKTDDTAAFQSAFDRAAHEGGGTVYAARGNYLFRGHLTVPSSVTLAGTFHAPPAHNGIRDAGLPKPGDDGTTLLVTGSAGDEVGTPFLTLGTNSTLKGVVIYYPDQDPKATPRPYPYTIRMTGKNPAILDTELLNPYRGILTTGSERHLIRNVHGQPLRLGILVDQIYDIGRIENVHFNPWWSMSEPVMTFMRTHGEGFVFAKTDWEYVIDSFCIMYKVGMRFTEFRHGPGNVVLTQSGSDVGPNAVLVEASQQHAGIAFNNCQFMAGIVVTETNTGPVKFSNCGFWGIETTTHHADLAGRGHVTFNGCHFNGWDNAKTGAACIRAHCEGLTVQACDFMDSGKHQISLGQECKAPIVVGNRLRGGEMVEGKSAALQMGLNATV